MIVPKFIPRAGATLFDAAAWIRGVSAAFARGVTLGEHMAGAVVSFRFNSDRPPTVAVDLASSPTSAVLLAARLTDGGATTLSGGVVTWAWAPTGTKGAVLVSSLAALTASTDYDVTLWLVGG